MWRNEMNHVFFAINERILNVFTATLRYFCKRVLVFQPYKLQHPSRYETYFPVLTHPKRYNTPCFSARFRPSWQSILQLCIAQKLLGNAIFCMILIEQVF